ncbi:MAG TPA: fatty acid desaturase [Burkholderiaceae bacterium]|nr:fatty acid desaturase [Burkholderiaceae bacterium]
MLDPLLNWLSNGLAHASAGFMVAWALIATHITIIAVTVYLHRSQAHRALDVHPVIAHFFRFWLWLTTGMVTKEWVAIHRKHHAKCETEDDPHSPITRGIETVFWCGSELYRAEAKNKETIAKFSHGAPDDWVERNVYSKFQWQGVGLMLIIDLLMFGAIGATIWAVQMLWIPVMAAGVINGIGHYWGYRNFDSPDRATNIFPVGLIIGGEELHNNHHTFATSARLSNKWWEFDAGWMYIKLLSYVGLAKVRKVAPRPKLTMPRPSLDLDALQAVIANRYDLMAKYAKSLQHAFVEERRHVPQVYRDQVKRWLHLNADRLGERERETLSQVLAHSKPLKTLYEMRQELVKLWERSNLSTEQLLAHLQSWCQRAEASGVRALQEMAVRVRSYA